MACGLARVHLVVCGGRGYAAAVVPPSLVRPLRASQSPFPFSLRLISIDPFFGLVGPYAADGGRCQVPVVTCTASVAVVRRRKTVTCPPFATSAIP